MSDQLLNKLASEQPTFSVELWPPRSEAAKTRLEEALSVLRGLAPDFVSITYGAGGSTRERTHELVRDLKAQGWTIPMAHLTCAAHTTAQLQAILHAYRDIGVNHILALRGDPPLDATAPLSDGELLYASELVRLAKDTGDFCVAVAVHPEGHPQSASPEEDRKYLSQKLAAADFGITQFYFEADKYSAILADLDSRNIVRPIVPGVMVPASWKSLLKMSELSGTAIPPRLLERFERFADDPESLRKAGVEVAVGLAKRALADGAPGVHVYSMNSSASTAEIYAAVFG